MKISVRLKAAVPYLLFLLLCLSGLIVGIVTLTYCNLTLKFNLASSVGVQIIATTAWMLPFFLGYRWLKRKRGKTKNKVDCARMLEEANARTPQPDPPGEYPDESRETPPLPPKLAITSASENDVDPDELAERAFRKNLKDAKNYPFEE